LEPILPPSTYERARRKKVARRLARAVRGEDTQELLPLDEVTRRLRLFDQVYVGVRSIPLDRIVGTVDRTREFDREFLPRTPRTADRWRRVERAFPDGAFPPIVAYEVDGSYFIVDGHHRVAIARQRGMTHIDAEVTRLRTGYPLPSGADIRHIVHLEQERLFMEESGLERARPEAHITFSRPQGYVELLQHLKAHGYDLMLERGEVLPREEVAADWYDRVYLPAVDAVRRARLHEALPGATDGDLFLALEQRRASLVPERGGVGVEEAARELREAARRDRPGGAARRVIGKLAPTRVVDRLAPGTRGK
jgi:hypothetical protein